MTEHLERLISDASVATVIRTGYTVTLETPRRRYLFTDKATSMRCFSAAATLKRDVLASGVKVEHYRPRSIAYYDIAERIPPSCWCVDIRSAYPTALRNMGAISDGTYHMLGRMDKVDRLKAVGMLASRRFIQDYVRGRLTGQRIDENPAAPYFYAACHDIGSVMQHLRETVDGFVLFWVDGLFVDIDDPSAIVDTLAAMGYDTKAERVTGLRLSLDGRYLHYTKGGKSTYLCIPRRVEYDDAELVANIHNATTL